MTEEEQKQAFGAFEDVYKRQIQERTGKDLGATFLSGTTISNSLTELYLLFKYLRPCLLYTSRCV